MILPKGWIKASLEDVVFFQEGPGLRKYQYREEGIPFLNIRTLIDESVNLNLCKYLDKDEVESTYQHFLLNTGDIVCSTSGTIGKTAIIKSTDLPLMLNTSIIRFKSKDLSIVDNGFIYYFLKSNHFFEQADELATGTAQKNIGPSHLKQFYFPVPPLNEQKRITKKMDELYVTVKSIKIHLDNASTTIKRFRQSILTAATSGKLTEDWREKNKNEKKINIDDISKSWSEIYKENEKKYQKPNLELNDVSEDELPNKWNKTQLGYVFDVYVGSTPSRTNEAYWKGDIPWVSSGEVAFNSIKDTKEKITKDGLKNTSTNIHPVGTILLAMIGQGKTRGQPAILEIMACHNQNTAALRVNKTFSDSKYLYYYLWERYEKTREVGSGNNQKALNKKAVQTLPFPLPPLAEQKEIVILIESLFTLADSLESKIQAAKKRVDKLTQSILAKAFKGELVPQNLSDEPAEKLLERKKAEKEKVKLKNTSKKKLNNTIKCNNFNDLKSYIKKIHNNNYFSIDEIRNQNICSFEKLTNYLFELIEKELVVSKIADNKKLYKLKG